MRGGNVNCVIVTNTRYERMVYETVGWIIGPGERTIRRRTEKGGKTIKPDRTKECQQKR